MNEFPKFKVKDTDGAFYDADSVTMLEVASKLYGKMNEIIVAFNDLSEFVNKSLLDFSVTHAEEHQAFETALRQEFQDFIDTVDLKLQGGD